MSYDPSQPRIPGGQPEGGEWTAGGTLSREDFDKLNPVHRMNFMKSGGTLFDGKHVYTSSSGLVVSINEKGELLATKAGQRISLTHGRITSIEELKKSGSQSDAALANAVEKLGGTHILGAKVVMQQHEAMAARHAIDTHPANIARKAKFDKHNSEEIAYQKHYASVIGAMTINGKSY